MTHDLIVHTLCDYRTVRGVQYEELHTSFQLFGRKLHTAPVVVVFHALTGNSDVCGKQKGWWKEIIGEGKCIDLERYTVIAFNNLGNGYDGVFVDNYQDFVARDMAIIAYESLRHLGVSQIYATIGGSLGGGIAWELVAEYPTFAQYLIAVATDWKSTDWVMGVCGTQEQILLNSQRPIADARRMAMFFYRTPVSLGRKFNRGKQNANLHKVNSWLNHHGDKLEGRFSKKAYLMMNHLLATIDIAEGRDLEELLDAIDTTIVQIGIPTDILFTTMENKKTQALLDAHHIPNHYHEIISDDGHDAFLIEHEQLTAILDNYF